MMSKEIEVCTYVTIVLLSSLSTSGREGDPRSYSSEVHDHRFLSSREKWTHSYVSFPCSFDEDCFPLEYHNATITIPPSLISCDNSTGLCECRQCFVRINDRCEVNRNACNRYLTDTRECSDDRKSQRTALLLSVFLSAAGAANFYIGQNVLGGVQLGLLLLLIFLMCALVCVPCCLCACFYDVEEEDFGDIFDSACVMFFVVSTLFMVILLIAVVVGWWITDLVVFIIGGRGDGNGCALYADL